MHKSKEGKVIASLTEVKNKTGDIFALADEFGEVILTSYNKPRYRLLKISIDEILELESKNSPSVNTPKVTEKKSVLNKVKSTVNSIAAKSPIVTTTTVIEPAPQIANNQPEEKTLIKKETIEKLSKLKAFDRESKEERVFVKRALIPLQ